jgi:hypothetical protein
MLSKLRSRPEPLYIASELSGDVHRAATIATNVSSEKRKVGPARFIAHPEMGAGPTSQPCSRTIRRLIEAVRAAEREARSA